MLRLFLRNRNVRKKRRTMIRPLLSISAKRTRLNMRSNKRPKESEKKKKGKSNVYENSKRRQLTDRQKLML